MRKFKRAQARNQASIEKHLAEQRVDDTLDSSSDDDDNENSRDALQQAVTKVLSSYRLEGGDTEKSLSYLTDIFQSGGAICLICISSVKKMDPIWSCSVCFSFVHLPCVQHWIRDSLSYKREKGITPLWACPKCRMEYREDEIPRRYLCFCGQTTDPPYQPWSMPHSCGEKCDKPLRPACGHRCTLLCHPGPCPPCPKMVTVECFCGSEAARTRRCNAKDWSCGKICSKKLPNCEHRCLEKCHPKVSPELDCPPCSKILRIPCHCGDKIEDRRCSKDIDWSCDKLCGSPYSCKAHFCQGHCHRSTDCGDCPWGKNRTCPCGKKRYADVKCRGQQPTEAPPTCGDTCGKLLDCGSHYCNMRCHSDRCGTCLEVVTKSCRCLSHEKEIACAKEFHCNKKCTAMRACGKHMCNKKCCDCPLRETSNICEKLCDNTLNCQRHKCLAPCHSGPCYPCPRTNVVQCRCGNSKITVPCGRIKRIKSPNCNKICKIPPVCHHTKRETHKCHHGACPPCRKICDKIDKKCSHPCVAVCHTKVWVKIGPKRPLTSASCFVKSDEERMQLKNLPCPPCEVSVMVTCLGGHETIPLPCHRAVSTSCQRPCGRLLVCTRHTCELPCHRVYEESSDPGDGASKCAQCERPCSLPRPRGCSHPCPRFCHEGACYPCKQLVKVSCHCGINSLYKRCARLTKSIDSSATNDESREELLKCGNRCPKNYPCGHRCVENCHSGECPNAEACAKRVKLWCVCKRIKKEFPCVELRRGKNATSVDCDDICRTMKRERERIGEIETARKRREEEARDRIEVERFERKFNKPRRRGRERTLSSDNSHGDWRRLLKKVGVVLGLLSIAIATTVFLHER